MSKRGRITVDDLPDEVKEILRGEAHRGQRNTFVIRLGIAIVGLINAFAVAGSNAAATQRIGVFAGLAALAFAIVGLLLARRPAYPFWFKYIGVTVDASVVSMASIASLYSPSGAYEVLLFPTAPILYMMFNMLTALQFSVRLSLFAAVMAGLHRSLLFGYCVQQKLVVLSPTSVYGTRALATDDQLTTILFIFGLTHGSSAASAIRGGHGSQAQIGANPGRVSSLSFAPRARLRRSPPRSHAHGRRAAGRVGPDYADSRLRQDRGPAYAGTSGRDSERTLCRSGRDRLSSWRDLG
jgi:hypothetical protein